MLAGIQIEKGKGINENKKKWTNKFQAEWTAFLCQGAVSLCIWDYRASKAALFDSFDNIEEGGIRASSSYSQNIDDHTNDKAIKSLEDRVSFLKKGNEMDASRGIMAGTMDRFKIVN
ncbi:hypothetical protein Vadar_027101 [Vaccinium darrowii]|uniref:Uncharacterized protein n=1 Tax=Vaccinium darrowii TaxID=229202 RepID=A0ACB7XTC5_9ERIC|nr:hypothetical protein Vadar_027101 [Vaccinium darrowii]